MLDGNNDPVTVGEVYAGAVSNGSTRVGNDHTQRTSGDIVAAAGMSTYRTGMALMRLMSEWQSGATPPQAEAPTARELKKQGAAADLADAESRRLVAQCSAWHLHENKLRFQRLKTLPTIRAGLLHWVREREWENPEQLVADTLRHFLSPVCPTCEGRKRRVIQSRAIGPECRKCRGTGEADLQHGGRGRALLAYMKQCTGQASGDLREGAHRLRRSEKGEADRFNQRHHEKVEQLQRADAEAKADEAQDNAAVAEKFRTSMERTRS